MEDSIQLFEQYYKSFDNNLSGVLKKHDHTMRVVKYAQEIAKSLNLNEEDIILASKCALFHDIARFKQWALYSSFEDGKTFDHGDVGKDIIEELGITDKIIIAAVKNHNKYSLLEDIDERTKLFCDITRDADKIDIMLTIDRKCDDEEYNVPSYIIDSFREKRLVSFNKNDYDIISDASKILRTIAFVFDMVFTRSFEIVKESNIVNEKFDLILNKFDEDDIKEIKDICNKYIDERLSE